MSGSIADIFGRRNGLMMSNVLIFFSAFLNIFSKPFKSYEMLTIANMFAGIFSGLSSSILSLYIMEISPDNLRGFNGSMNQLTSNSMYT